MRTLIITDSMALPRPFVPYQKTWPYYLKKKFNSHDFICICHRNLTTNYLSSGWLGDSLEFYNPNVVIVQLGVVDCAPRFIISKGILKKIISRSPNFLKFFLIRITKALCTRKIKYAEVSIGIFDKNIKQYLNRCISLNVKKIIFIAIGNIDDSVDSKSPNFRESIKMYNSILYKYENLFPIVTVIDPLSSELEALFCDGYHPSSNGHAKIFNELLNCYNLD